MHIIKPKKHLGQHFLRNEDIAGKIANSLTGHGNYNTVVEIGAGTGVLSKYLVNNPAFKWIGIDVDKESIDYLKRYFPGNSQDIIEQDFLSMNIADLSGGNKLAIIGNFPYNISSQILFKVLENRHLITEVVGMFQKEVALRVVAGPGGKVNGILSILCQAFYDIEYLFKVDEHEFIPAPAVKSAVIRLKRNNIINLPFSDKHFFKVVKTSFNQRRKTLQNALKSLNPPWESELIAPFKNQRAEQLSVRDFIKLGQSIPSG